MAFLLQLLLKLCDLACWLCTKRAATERRLDTETLIRREQDRWGRKGK